VGRSTTLRSFARIVRGDALHRTFAAHRAATKGWAVLRRARAVVGSVGRAR